jgi:hypothetical protein
MSADAQRALQLESEFLAGVQARLAEAQGTLLRGSMWERTSYDEVLRARELVQRHGGAREQLKAMPTNRRVALLGSERTWLFWRRRTGVAVASTLSPLEHYASGSTEPAPPTSLADLREHVKQLVGDGRVPVIVGVCSPSGFSEEARRTRLDLGNATVVLIEPDQHGGWQVGSADEHVDPRIIALFDPEDIEQKVGRVREEISARSADLLTGSLSTEQLAADLALPESLVRTAFVRIAETDPELRLTEQDGQLLLYRGAATDREERRSMSVMDRFRQIFSGDADDAEKINVLTERRAALNRRRERIYEDIAKLESKERDLVAEGKAATSSVPRRRIAAQLAQIRKDISRQNATASVLNQQIDIISTNIHNLTMIRQGESSKLPTTDELAENAAKAEEMLERLKADSDLVTGLETGLNESTMSEEELAILAELEGTDEPSEKLADPAVDDFADPSRESSSRSSHPAPPISEDRDRPERSRPES